METKLRHVSDVPVQIGLPTSLVNLVKRERFQGKHEAQLGKAVDITQFGVNRVILEPGSISSLRHWHECEDEFIYVLSGQLTLVDENGEHALIEGSIAGFPAGHANAHHLVNRSQAPATFLAMGMRKSGLETIHYPDDFAEPKTVLRDENGKRVDP
jgi:uncharacterized cupin superfamily protein